MFWSLLFAEVFTIRLVFELECSALALDRVTSGALRFH